MLPNLKVENLSCVRSEKAIFKNLNFEVLPGQNIEIVGSNGSGKTTLLRTLLGLLTAEGLLIGWMKIIISMNIDLLTVSIKDTKWA